MHATLRETVVLHLLCEAKMQTVYKLMDTTSYDLIGPSSGQSSKYALLSICVGFSSLRLLIDKRTCAHLTRIFPRLAPLPALLVLVSSSDWFIVVFISVVIG